MSDDIIKKKREEIFHTAVEMDDPVKRSAFLNHACDGDTKLRAEVEDLLKHDAAASDFMAKPAHEFIVPNGSLQPEVTVDSGADQPMHPNPRVSDVVHYFGNYELLEEIARGGMGVVYKARQVDLNRIVAVKMILAGQLADEREVTRFYMEAEAAANLQHPGIVAIHEVGEHCGQHYFSMDFIDGKNLAELVREHPLPAREAAEIIKQVAEATQYAHDSGVVHRDLKPANILIDREGFPKITDFGLAKMLVIDEGESRSELTTTGQILGTPSYMSPEQAGGKRSQIGSATDIYSLGAILYACLTGRAPFMADSPVDTLLHVMNNEPAEPRSLNPKAPKDLETICLKCLRKESKQRYSSAEAMAEDLNRWIEGRPVLARPIGTLHRTARWCRRNPILAGLSATVLSLLMVVTVGSIISAWQINASLQREQVLHENAESRHREAKRQLSRFSVANGARLLEEDRLIPALVWFGEAMASEQDFEGRTQSHRTRIASWLRQCPRLLRLWTPEERRNWTEPSTAGVREVAAEFGTIHYFSSHFTADGDRVIVASNRDALLRYEYAPDTTAHRTTAGSMRWSEVRLIDVDGATAPTVLDGRESLLAAPAISADGRYVALLSKASEVEGDSKHRYLLKTFSTATGEATGVPLGLDRVISRAAFSADGKLLATAVSGTTGSSDGTPFERNAEVRIWHVETGELVSPPITLPPQWVPLEPSELQTMWSALDPRR